MGPRAGLDGRKISSPPGFDPGPSIAIPNELPGPHIYIFCISIHVRLLQIKIWGSKSIQTPVKTVFLVRNGDHSSTMVKVLCYKSEGRWFDPSWCHWNFSLT